MPNDAPTIPSYGKPIDHQAAPPPNFRPTATLLNPKDQKPLNSAIKKMLKAPKGKIAKLSGKLKMTKPGKKHKVHFY